MKKIILWSAVSISAVAVVAAAVVIGYQEPSAVTQSAPVENKTAPKSCISPPLPGMEQPLTSYIVNGKNGGSFKHVTGSQIEIPAQAFVRPDGSPVDENVRISYREFHSPADVFLSGIPMEYDSAGTVRTFETAGMLQILATEENNGVETPLQLANDKQIAVKMVSTSADPKFNHYELDTVTGKWSYLGKDRVEKTPRKPAAQIPTAVKKQFVSLAEPVLADPKRFTFTIAFDKSEYPELAAYEHVKFEVTDNSFRPVYYKINWDNVSLAKDDDNRYMIRLKKVDTTIVVGAKPVFDKTHYPEARVHFDAAVRENQSREARDELARQAKLDKVNSEMTQAEAGLMVYANRMINAMGIRRLSIAQLGVHNIDVPIQPEIIYLLSLSRPPNRVQNAEPVTYKTIYVVEKGRNAVFRYDRGKPVQFNPRAENLIWTITGNNQVAFFRTTDLSRLASGSSVQVSPVPAADQNAALERIRNFSGV